MTRPHQNKAALLNRRHRTASLSRVAAVLGCLFVVAGGSFRARAATDPFGFKQVVGQARELSRHAYQPPPKVPSRFRELDFDQWNGIRSRPDKPLWPGGPFHVLMRPAGYLFSRPVTIHLVDGSGVHVIPFQPDRFDYDAARIGGSLPSNLGYAGFRLLYRINSPDRFDEFLNFLGASYFRAVPRDGRYGLSARGLAIDTAEPGGEEFPRFSAFWLVRPAPDARQMTVYALLDSPSATGAYRFVIRPGKSTTVAVKATVFLRKPVKKLGLAPLTSMYYYGVGDHRPSNSPFPAIHDSDGLLIHAGNGKWTWRPLDNPKHVLISRFPLRHVKGFGLMQRDRRFKDYQSLAIHYQDRPSAWITPAGDWGAGHVELVEFGTGNSNTDNVTAYWVPDEVPPPGKPLHIAYTIDWQLREPVRSPAGRVVATLVGGDATQGTTKFVIDYSGKELASLGKDSGIHGVVEVDPDTKIVENRILKNPHVDGWRQVIQVLPLPDRRVRVRAWLARGDHRVTEVWTRPVAAGPGTSQH